MCHVLYAPMRVLCLADQKSPTVDKLYYCVLQTDQILPKYISDVEEQAGSPQTGSTLLAMDRQASASLSDDDEDASNNDNDVEDIGSDNGYAQLGNNDDDSDNKQQVLM